MCPDDGENSALVVVDMQAYFRYVAKNYRSSNNIRVTNEVIAKQVETIKIAKEKGIHIILVQYKCITPTGQREVCGDLDEEIVNALGSYSKGHIIKKTTNDLFDLKNEFNSDVKSVLTKNKIGTLIVTGANGSVCVKETMLGALRNNCDTIAYTAGIADYKGEKDFIFPYTGYYDDIEANCTSCSFSSIASFSELEPHMKSYNFN